MSAESHAPDGAPRSTGRPAALTGCGIFMWTLPCEAFEDGREVGRGREAQRVGNVGHRHLTRGQQLLGAFNLPAKNIFGRRYANLALEPHIEMRSRQVEHLGDIIESDLLVKVHLDMSQRRIDVD